MMNLLYFATPESFGQKILRHWLTLIGLVGVVLIVVGLVAGLTTTTWIGSAVVLTALGGWLISRAFGNWIKGYEPFHHVVKAIAIVLGVVLLALGVWKLWDLAGPYLT